MTRIMPSGRMDLIDLPSGRQLVASADRLLAFFREEYEYYDAIPSGDPFHVSPLDVLVTVSVNSFVNNAAKVRTVHRGLAAACDPLLRTIPVHADLRTFPVSGVRDLLHAAVQQRSVLTAVATKVLHRKRPALIPMLDSVLIGYYAAKLSAPRLVTWATGDKARAADAATVVLREFRADLIGVSEQLEDLRETAGSEGYDVTAARILELLLWMDCEDRGYYR